MKTFYPQPAEPKNKIGIMIGLTLFSFLVGGSASRGVPDGPFISIVGDIIPMITSVLGMGVSFLILRHRPRFWLSALCLFCIYLCTLAIGNILVSVVSFWLRPRARGVLIGL
jgi:hypothetical protein